MAQQQRLFVSRLRAKAFRNVGSNWLDVELKAGLVAVVGPNGCGKSNLLLALLFAFAAPVSSLGVGQLAELQNSDSTEVCEVHVQLASSRSSQRHTVAAALAPDGSRTFKLNGKSKTGKELREFLKSAGISLDSSGAVIKQAQVTRLADTNSPADLAAVVADASGLGRWNQERRAAAEELARTHQAIVAVQGKLQTLEASLADDRQALAALQRLEALEGEIGAAEQEQRGRLGRGLAGCEAHLVEAAGAISRLQEEQAAKERELEALQAQQGEINKQQAAAGAAPVEAAATARQRAMLQEEVAILEEQLEEHSRQQRALDDSRAAALRATEQLVRVSAALPAAIAAAGDALLSNVDAEACRRTLQQLAQERDRLEATLASLAGAAAPPPGAEAQAQQLADLLEAKRAEQAALQEQLLPQHAQLAPPGTASCWPLHMCFQFRLPAEAECGQLATALDVMAGRQLGVYVAEDLAKASQFLGSPSGSGRRVWASDCLSPADNRARFASVAAQFQPGEVVVPTDLLSYGSKHEAAVLRAFGGFVIARDDAVAAALIERHAVPSVTLEGRISQKGSLQGGWRPERQGATAMDTKLRCDTLAHAVRALAVEVSGLEQQAARLQRMLAEHEQREVARTEAESQLKEVAEETAACASTLELHELLTASGSSVEALQAEQRRLQQEVREHQQAAEGVEADLQGCNADQLAAELEQRVAELQQLERSMQEQQAAAQQEQERQDALRAEACTLQQRLDAWQLAAEAAAQQLQAAQQRHGEAGSLRRQLSSLAEQLGPSLQPVQLSASPTASARGGGLPLVQLQKLAKECGQQHKAIVKLREEKAALAPGSSASLVQQQARARQAAHAAHQRQLGQLQQAVITLEQYIANSNGKVVEANNAAAAAILSLFTSLCSEVLPRLAFKFELPGGDAHEGVALQFAQRGREQQAWDSSLDALSGGQRTLVSLAFILASHMVGASCGVLLLDEVDAALDESNQHLVGRLLSHMLGQQGAASCSQVLCVSHNPALQELCSHVVILRPGQPQPQQGQPQRGGAVQQGKRPRR